MYMYTYICVYIYTYVCIYYQCGEEANAVLLGWEA